MNKRQSEEATKLMIKQLKPLIYFIIKEKIEAPEFEINAGLYDKKYRLKFEIISDFEKIISIEDSKGLLKIFCNYCEQRTISPKRFSWEEIVNDFLNEKSIGGKVVSTSADDVKPSIYGPLKED